MDLFSHLNSIYTKFFGTSPPTRACVTVDLPPPTRVKLDCIAYAQSDASEQKALHVQGLSYWAPANFSPYSQAIHVGEQVFISGQIKLIPSSLSLPSPSSLATEAVLAFQHINRITCAVGCMSGGIWEEHKQLALYWFVDQMDAIRVCSTCKAYTKVLTFFLFSCLEKEREEYCSISSFQTPQVLTHIYVGRQNADSPHQRPCPTERHTC
jgi:diphthine-ammonia ligase